MVVFEIALAVAVLYFTVRGLRWAFYVDAEGADRLHKDMDRMWAQLKTLTGHGPES